MKELITTKIKIDIPVAIEIGLNRETMNVLKTEEAMAISQVFNPALLLLSSCSNFFLLEAFMALIAILCLALNFSLR